MPTPENRETQGLAGQDSDGPPWEDDVHRVQEAGGVSDATAEACATGTTDDGVPVRGSGQLFTVSDPAAVLEGFRASEWVPALYQGRGVEWLGSRTAGALFLPPGMGKTSISLAAFILLRELGHAKRLLVLAPLTVCRTTWLTEPTKFLQFQDLKVGLAHGPDKKLILNDNYYDLVILNYDGIEWAAPLLAQGHNFEVLLCDEIQRLKHTTSKRFKLLKPLLPTFKFRWGLTGTPAANGLMDLFGQCYVLDMGRRLGKFITHFRMTYFHQKPWDQYRYYITPALSAQLVDKIADMAMYMDPKEWLDLPDLINVPLRVELSAEQQKSYLFLEDEFILKLGDQNLTAANAGVLTSKLRQFTGGAVYVDGVPQNIHTAKIDRVVDLVDQLAGEPLLVSYQFEHEYERLLKAFPNALAIKGGMSGKKLSEVVAAWNTGEEPVLLVQPSAGALGLNLQFGGCAICWFSMTYNLEEYVQLIARLLRRGQEKAVRNYMILAKGTIDETVAKVLTTKDAVQEDVFRALKLQQLSKEK